jgi:signal transduction histidine kinase
MTKNIKLGLVFVLTYVFAFFVWWTFSLIDLSKQKASLTLQCETDRALYAKTYIQKGMDKGVNPAELKELMETKFPNLVIEMGEEPIVKISQQLYENNDKELYSEKKKYLLEGITMFLLIASGVIWIFIRIGRILSLSKQQNNFLLSVSHELKTPITAIQLAGQTLKINRKRLDDNNQNKLLEKVDSNSKRLNSLIDQMLLLTKLEGAQYEVNTEQINLKKLIDGVIDENISDLESHFKVINDVADDTFIRFDRLLIELCFSNLLQNAIKYSPNGGTIRFTEKSKGSYSMVSVSDEGMGISPSDKERIFEKFYRVGNEETRTSKGTGLGLYLVKQILTRHKGQIKVKDNAPNGSIFVVKLNK